LTAVFKARLQDFLVSFCAALILGAAAIACLALLGWQFNSATLRSGYPGLTAMNPTTAVTLLLAAVSFWVLKRRPEESRKKEIAHRLAQVGAAGVALVGVFKLGDYLLGWPTGIDNLLFGSKLATASLASPNRIAPNTALCLALLGLALLLLDAELGNHRPAEWLTLAAGLVAVLAVLGYAYGVSPLFGVGNYIPMALNSATAFALLCTGTLAARGDRGLMRIFLADSLGGVLARRMFPAALAIPAVLGWLRLQGVRRGLYDETYGVALFATANIVVFAALLYWTARSLDHADTQRRQAEEQRHAIEERFRVVAETANDAIVSADSRGHITYFNKAAERMFRHAAADVLGKPLTVIMPERFHDAHQRGLARFLSTGEARVIGKTVELAGKRKDGSAFPVELSLANWKAGGQTFFTAMLRDVTERKRAERARLALEERFRQFVTGVKDYAIFLLDAEGRVASWNQGAERIKGYRAEEILGRHFSCFYPREEVAQGTPQRLLERAAAEGRAEDEGWRVRKDGSRFWANVVFTAVRGADGSLRGFSKVTRDISERKAAQERLERQAAELARSNAELAAINKELDAFTYSVSHDLRAPLRQVDGFSRILAEELRGNLPNQARHCLERILEGVGRMGRLVDDLLNLGRAGRKPLTWERARLTAVVREAIAELQPDTRDRNIEWQIEELPEMECDPGLMKLVFVNLLSNAVKFTQRQPRAVIQVGSQMQNGQLVFFVRDNGIGFNMRHAHKLFGIFQRLHRQEDFQGSGVGLANVQRIIHKHGGRVWAEAEPYKGATFYFTLGAPDRSESTVGAGTRGEAWPSNS